MIRKGVKGWYVVNEKGEVLSEEYKTKTEAKLMAKVIEYKANKEGK